jgi:hypothetical protein
MVTSNRVALRPQGTFLLRPRPHSATTCSCVCPPVLEIHPGRSLGVTGRIAGERLSPRIEY